MSLQVWLPLNGDLHNQGLDNIVFAQNTGATIDNSGKIGKCYNFDASNDWIQYNIDKTKYANKPISYSYWFKCDQNDAGGAILDLAADLVAGYTYSSSGIKFTYWRCWSSSGTRSGDSGTTPNFYNANQWHHVAVIFNANINQIYVDGVLALTEDKSSKYTTYWTPLLGTSYNKFSIGKSAGDSNWIGGKVNDVRIYDHCLSDKEVEEISKGLVLHYQLNNGNPNLLSEYVTPGQGAPGVTSTGGRTNYYGKYGIIIPATENADTYFRLFLKQQLVQGTTYTISCYVSGLLPGSSYNFPLFAQGNTSMGILQLNHNGLCSLTFTMNSSSQKAATTPEGDTVYICFMDDASRTLASGQGAIIINGFKLEQGNNVTNFLSMNNDIIYDSSGYNNNGEIINTLFTEIPSPKNNISLHFSATNQKIKISGLSTTGFSNSYSFAWWEKINSVTPMHWGFSDGVRLNGMYTGRLWNTGDGSNNPLYNPGTTTQVTAPSINIWHHWVMTGDGMKSRVYQDGVLWAEAKTYKTITGTTIYINGWDTNTNYSSDNASISDFRIYATALTADQIKELYKTSKIIDGTTVKARDLEVST